MTFRGVIALNTTPRRKIGFPAGFFFCPERRGTNEADHLTVNTGRLAPKAADLIVSLTERHCTRASRS
jgi:hypothetical protein